MKTLVKEVTLENIALIYDIKKINLGQKKNYGTHAGGSAQRVPL